MSDKSKVFYSIETTLLDKLNTIAETKGPSAARYVEKAVEAYLKDKKPDTDIVKSKKKQACFYPSPEVAEKLEQVAKDEGRSVSNLVAFIVKNKLRDEEV